MSHASWQRLKDAVYRAVESPADQRDAVLVADLAHDPALLEHARSLIVAYDNGTQIGELLDVPPWRLDEIVSPSDSDDDVRPLLPPAEVTPGGVHSPDSIVWGDFVLLEELGRGGFGVVYRAWERALRREVALKLINSALHPTRRDSIQTEGQMLARVDHPNVVRIHGIHRHGDDLAISMEYVRGQTLAGVVSTLGPRPPREVAQTTAAIVGALSAVHQCGVLHRDIKASNVMRTPDGRVVLMDFGAGREWFRPAEERGHMVGTPAYMAPEVLAGGGATPASDVYSLGVLAFYLLRGEHPAPATQQAGLQPGTDAWAARVLPGTPPALATIVGRMLAADPQQRPVLDASLKRALQRAVPKPRPDDRATDVPRDHAWQRVLRWGVLAVVLSYALGVLSTTEYNMVLGRHAEFASESLWTPLHVGRLLLVPLVVQTGLLAIAAALIVLVWRGLAYVVPTGAAALTTRGRAVLDAARRRGLLNAGPVGLFACVVAVIAVGATLWSYRVMVAALTSSLDTGPSEVFGALHSDLEDPASFRSFLLLSFLWLAGAWRVCARLPSDTTAPIARAGLAGLAIVVALMLAIPYRVGVAEKVRQVMYDEGPCYVLGVSGQEWLIHCPLKPPPRNRVVNADDPRVSRTDLLGVPFDAYPLVPGYIPRPR